MNSQNEHVSEHLNQAYHNYKFYCEVHSKLPAYFADWKITILFYTAIHLLRAYLASNGIEPDKSHNALKRAIQPGITSDISKPVKRHCYNAYLVLYNASLDVRYTGYLDEAKRSVYLNNRLKKCEKALESIDAFMLSKNFKSIRPIQEEFNFDN